MDNPVSCTYCAGAGEVTTRKNNEQRARFYRALGLDPGEPSLPDDARQLVQCYFCSLRESLPHALAEFEEAERRQRDSDSNPDPHATKT